MLNKLEFWEDKNPGGSVVKKPSTMQKMGVQSLGRDNLPEKEMAARSRTLAWRIPWTEEPGGPQSMGLRRIGPD